MPNCYLLFAFRRPNKKHSTLSFWMVWSGAKRHNFSRSVTGWWYTYPSEKYEFVSWDDDIPNIWKVITFMFQTTNQVSISLNDPQCSAKNSATNSAKDYPAWIESHFVIFWATRTEDMCIPYHPHQNKTESHPIHFRNATGNLWT